MSPRKRAQAIVKLLAGLGDPDAGAALVDLAFDFVVDQPVSRFVEIDRVLHHVDLALKEAVTERALREHVRPFLDRERARAAARGDRVGDWLTAEANAELRALAARPVRFSRGFLDGLVKQEAVRTMLRSVTEESVNRFIASLKPGGSGGGVFGAVGRGALGIAGSMGKGILGGVGGQLESQLRGAASSFITGSMNLMLDRLVQTLSSPETAAQLGRMNLVGFEQLQKLETRTLMDALHRLPLDDLLEFVPGLLAHNLQRGAVRAGLREELEASLAVEGARTLRETLADTDAVAAWREDVRRIVPPLLAEWSGTEAFQRWIDGTT